MDAPTRNTGAATSAPVPTVTVTVQDETEVAATPDGSLETDSEPVLDGSSYETAYPFGTWGKVGKWEIRVLSITPDATQAVLSANQFNSDPRPGHQFYIARIAARYEGAGKGVFTATFT